ncbi:prealbumin-like fold domain-containing protein [Streptomyces sp. NPDC127114]|uniref:prealbumin-like fold domain-containing protein n=1 Tax=Streptomyces sp. NPDC127114 TaxID=3345366 RepID=UPI00362F24CB
MATALALPLSGLATAAQALTPGPPSGDGEQPQLVQGNPDCAELVPGSFEFRYEPVVDGTNVDLSPLSPPAPSGLSGNLDIDVRNTSQGQVFDFNLDGDFVALGVIVKGGPDSNFYDYRTAGNRNDTSLHSPLGAGPNGNRFFGLSHVAFCLGEAPRPGALKIVKNSTKGGLVNNAGAVFSVSGPGGFGTSVTDDTTMAAPDEDPTVGEVCISNLTPGTYTVNETTPPAGYGAATQTNVQATVVAGTTCSSVPAGATATFTNAPLADLLVRVDDQGSGEIQSTIACNGNSTGPSDPAILNVNDLPPGDYTCQIHIDP